MKKTGEFLSKLRSDRSGISSVEYALLLSFIAGGISLSVTFLGEAVGNEIEAAADCVVAADASACLPPPPKCCD